MNTPFYLTFIRIAISPLFLVLYLYFKDFGISITTVPYLLLIMFTTCELSDLFDGMVARRNNKVTNLGKVLDPMADSLFRLTVFLSFTQGIVQLPLVLVLMFFLRDFVVNSLRILYALKGVALGARLSGKIKAVIQATAGFMILFLMIPCSYGYLSVELFQNMSFYIVGFAAFYTLISGLEYVWVHWDFIKQNVLS